MQINDFNLIELLKPFALTRRSLKYEVDTRSRKLRGNSFTTNCIANIVFGLQNAAVNVKVPEKKARG